MRLDLPSGFVGEYEESGCKVELFVDGADRGRVNAVEEENSPPVRFAGVGQSGLPEQIGSSVATSTMSHRPSRWASSKTAATLPYIAGGNQAGGVS